jgi:AraC-like DNA-binding protein/ABC-type glycerol-3-phosphate transport system substrate-binding protein
MGRTLRQRNPESADGDKPRAWCFSGTAKAYGRLFPELHWEDVPVAWSVIDTAIRTELENRRSRLALTPVPYSALPGLAQEGWIRPLDPWFTPEQLSHYAPEALELATVGGRLYAVPDDILSFVFFIRRNLLESLKVGPPRTWAEFETLAARLAKRRLAPTMLSGGESFRLAFLLSLLGSNGVFPSAGAALIQDAPRMIECYDWLRRLSIERGLLPLEELTHPRSVNTSVAALRRRAWGFGWLMNFAHLSPAVLRRYVFLPFPRGPSLAEGASPWRPMRGTGWCMPWSRAVPDAAVAALRAIHAPETLRAIHEPEITPFIAVRSLWDDPEVCRRYPLYRSAASLVEGARPLLVSGFPHFRRLDVTFRNAVLDGLAGREWMEEYGGGMSAPVSIRSVLRAIDTHPAGVRGVSGLARSLGLHPVRLRRLLRRELNESAGAYFRKRRLETARALLAAGGLNVKQVAAQIGYRSDTAFSRAYRRHFGHSPTSPPQI